MPNQKLLLVLLMTNGFVHGQSLQVEVNANVPVPQGTLRQAVLQAERVFQKAGVASEWTVCSAQTDPCDGGDLVINIIEQPTEEAPASHWALATTNKTTGVAYVFFDRVTRSFLAQHHSLTALLAAVMAHEAGHVLGLEHATGVMHKEFGPKDLAEAEVGMLKFEDAQAVQLRAAAQTHLAAATQARTRGELAARNVRPALGSDSR